MSERVKRPLAGCLVCVGCLALLTVLAFEVGPLGRFDARVLDSLLIDKGSWAGEAAQLLADLGNPLPQLILLALVCWLALRCDGPRYAAAAIVLVAGANLTTQVLKAALAHPRHHAFLGEHQISSTSFPSGHATAALAMALAFALVAPPSWHRSLVPIAIALALALGSSMVVLRYHYPSDVLGGWLVAGAWFFGVVAALQSNLSSRGRDSG